MILGRVGALGSVAVRLVSYASDRGPRAGLRRDDSVLDAWDALGGGGASVRELLASGRLGELEAADGEAIPLDEVDLLPPVPDPEKIIGIGLNYRGARRRGRDRAAFEPDLLRQVPQRAPAGRRDGHAPRRLGQGRLRGRGRVRDRAAGEGCRRGRRPRPRRRLHALQRPLRPRPAVRDAAVDAGQGLRRRRPLRSGAGDPGRGGAARRDRDRARPERRADAGVDHRRPRLLDPGAGRRTSPG